MWHQLWKWGLTEIVIMQSGIFQFLVHWEKKKKNKKNLALFGKIWPQLLIYAVKLRTSWKHNLISFWLCLNYNWANFANVYYNVASGTIHRICKGWSRSQQNLYIIFLFRQAALKLKNKRHIDIKYGINVTAFKKSPDPVLLMTLFDNSFVTHKPHFFLPVRCWFEYNFPPASGPDPSRWFTSEKV